MSVNLGKLRGSERVSMEFHELAKATHIDELEITGFPVMTVKVVNSICQRH